MGKKPHKPTKSSKKSGKYAIEGGKLVTKGKSCPKCGVGVFMAEHKDRSTCGRCNYTVFKKA